MRIGNYCGVTREYSEETIFCQVLRSGRLVGIPETFSGVFKIGRASDLHRAGLSHAFDPGRWIGANYKEDDRAGALVDLHLLLKNTAVLLAEEKKRHEQHSPDQQLKTVAQLSRHKIATREPLTSGESADVQVATLWGAKGVTAEHVYILGVGAHNRMPQVARVRARRCAGSILSSREGFTDERTYSRTIHLAPMVSSRKSLSNVAAGAHRVGPHGPSSAVT